MPPKPPHPKDHRKDDEDEDYDFEEYEEIQRSKDHKPMEKSNTNRQEGMGQGGSSSKTYQKVGERKRSLDMMDFKAGEYSVDISTPIQEDDIEMTQEDKQPYRVNAGMMNQILEIEVQKEDESMILYQDKNVGEGKDTCPEVEESEGVEVEKEIAEDNEEVEEKKLQDRQNTETGETEVVRVTGSVDNVKKECEIEVVMVTSSVNNDKKDYENEVVMVTSSMNIDKKDCEKEVVMVTSYVDKEKTEGGYIFEEQGANLNLVTMEANKVNEARNCHKGLQGGLEIELERGKGPEQIYLNLEEGKETVSKEQAISKILGEETKEVPEGCILVHSIEGDYYMSKEKWPLLKCKGKETKQVPEGEVQMEEAVESKSEKETLNTMGGQSEGEVKKQIWVVKAALVWGRTKGGRLNKGKTKNLSLQNRGRDLLLQQGKVTRLKVKVA